MDTNVMLVKALELMGMGVGGVFVVLAVFFGLVLLMRKIFPARDGDEGNT
jgi:Na+-transporting methylmalonyl-CoA/oxaloacetate decarboxylase gamma subunit